MSVEHLETERLILRRPQPDDAPEVFKRYANDRQVTKYLGWPTHRTIEDTRAFLASCEQEWTRWPAGPYMVESREDGQLLGSAGLAFETPRQAVTGYVFAKDAWGKGYATEALTEIIRVAARVGVMRLYALCHPEHKASAHVLEKCGFQREGILHAYSQFPNLTPGRRGNVVCYGMAFRR
jgi:ribosomal-protein-alanine N-acetyltransferase